MKKQCLIKTRKSDFLHNELIIIIPYLSSISLCSQATLDQLLYSHSPTPPPPKTPITPILYFLFIVFVHSTHLPLNLCKTQLSLIGATIELSQFRVHWAITENRKHHHPCLPSQRPPARCPDKIRAGLCAHRTYWRSGHCHERGGGGERSRDRDNAPLLYIHTD